MSVNHPNRNRIIPPLGFVELHLRLAAVQSRRAAATVFLTGAHTAAGADCRAARAAGSDLCVTRQLPDNADGGHAVLGGFGSFHAPVQEFVHGTLPGEQLGTAPDGTRLRFDIMDSDLLLLEEAVVRRRHGALSFVFSVQLFVDEAVVSWSGAHYMYPVRARVVNVRDRSVQWVTVAYIPHVGKPVARTAAARFRTSDTRNGFLQRCLAVLLRRFVGASQVGVQVVFPGQRAMTAVPRLIGLVADQLGERSVFCLMRNTCEFFCSHCMVRRDVAGGPGRVGAAARDVTAVLDAQLEGDITRDGDPRPSLRGHLRTEHRALAFVPAVGAIWG